jgi:hypothetical protein
MEEGPPPFRCCSDVNIVWVPIAPMPHSGLAKEEEIEPRHVAWVEGPMPVAGVEEPRPVAEVRGGSQAGGGGPHGL